MVHYRALFDELLGTAPPTVEVVPASERARELRNPEQRPQA